MAGPSALVVRSGIGPWSSIALMIRRGLYNGAAVVTTPIFNIVNRVVYVQVRKNEGVDVAQTVSVSVEL